MMNSLTPIQDIDKKIDILDHVNQDHPQELLAIASAHSTNEVLSATVLDIYQEGVLLLIKGKTELVPQKIMVPFAISGDIEDKILYLAYAAMAKQNTEFGDVGKCFFEIIDNRQLTAHMLRLTVKSSAPLPVDYPGYAYAFILKVIKKVPVNHSVNSHQKSWLKSLFDRSFIWLMKHLSPDNRQRLLQKANKDIRLYTLRKSWAMDSQSTAHNYGYIDIFTHDNTAGSQWAKGLVEGDVIMSRSGNADRHPHLAQGQAVLIADETAYPALAGILERWQNPLPAHIILLSATDDEQQYFSAQMLANTQSVQRIICPPNQQAEKVLEVLKQLATIEVAWGAFEAKSAKKVRHYLRNERQIVGKNNHTKAYWVLKSKSAQA